MGGLPFSDDPRTIRLNDFRFRINETFLYEYDYTDDWRHQVCVEAILVSEAQRHCPTCIDGRCSCPPPENCDGPRTFMVLRQQYSPDHIMMRLTQLFAIDYQTPRKR